MDEKRKERLTEFVNSLGLEIQNYKKLNTAFTHPTFVFENKRKGLSSNQRLEFLGDSVLELAISDYLFLNYPRLPEGDLTKMRAAVVCEASLAKIAQAISLGKYLLLGKGEEMSGGRQRASILADAFEAVMGALYLELGFLVIQKLIIELFEEAIIKLDLNDYGDYKTMLQELVQRTNVNGVHYVILDEVGPDHNKIFTAGVMVEEEILARGVGSNKKEAEQKAAQKALEDIRAGKVFKEIGQNS